MFSLFNKFYFRRCACNDELVSYKLLIKATYMKATWLKALGNKNFSRALIKQIIKESMSCFGNMVLVNLEITFIHSVYHKYVHLIFDWVFKISAIIELFLHQLQFSYVTNTEKTRIAEDKTGLRFFNFFLFRKRETTL